MVADPSINFQKSIYSLLSTDAVIANTCALAQPGATTIVKVFDRVPQGITGDKLFPFINIGDDHITSFYDFGDFSEVHCNIHIYSRGTGKPEANMLAARVKALLDPRDSKITVEGFAVSEAWYVDTMPMKEPDGVTVHLAMTFRYLLVETP